MTDTWEVAAIATDGRELGLFRAIRYDPPAYVYDGTDTVEICRAMYAETGVVGKFLVYKNSDLYANCLCRVPFVVTTGSYQDGTLLVCRSELVPPSKPSKVCTCGGWAVYGKEADIHADDIANTCDLRRK